MLETYINYTKGMATDEEMGSNEISRFSKLGLGFVILPGAPINPLIVKLGQKLGVGYLIASKTTTKQNKTLSGFT